MIAFVLTATAPSYALAALGDDATSVARDRVQMRGTVRVTSGERYTVHAIEAATGTVVREYVTPNGTVFAITWDGPWLPDLRQLLGSYFGRYARAAQARGVVRRPLLIDESGLVVHVGGRPRAFVGKAYVPEMFPDGVRVETLR